MSQTNLRWVGLSKSGDKRIWGYISDNDSPWTYGTSFWGRGNGKIYFQNTRLDEVFKKNFKRKREKYAEEPALADRVIQEYEMHLMLKKLKGF